MSKRERTNMKLIADYCVKCGGACDTKCIVSAVKGKRKCPLTVPWESDENIALIKYEAAVRELLNWHISERDISQVKYDDETTTVIFADKTRTSVKVYGDDKFSKEAGLALCMLKKACGSNRQYHKLLEKFCK